MAHSPADGIEFMVAHHTPSMACLTELLHRLESGELVGPLIGAVIDQIAKEHQLGACGVFISRDKVHVFEQGLQLVMLAM